MLETTDRRVWEVPVGPADAVVYAAYDAPFLGLRGIAECRGRDLRDVALHDAPEDVGIKGDELGDQAVVDACDPGLGLPSGSNTQGCPHRLAFGGGERISCLCNAQRNKNRHQLGHLECVGAVRKLMGTPRRKVKAEASWPYSSMLNRPVFISKGEEAYRMLSDFAEFS